MAHAHFKDKLLKDLVDKSAPFRCPAADCSYQTRERDKWSRHYGSVHGFIKKYLKQYFDENPDKAPLKLATSQKSAATVAENMLTTVTRDHTNAEDHSKSPHITTKSSNDPKVKEKFILKVTI